MKKATVTLSNIPSGGVTKLYYVSDLNGDNEYWITKDPQTITVGESVLILKRISTEPDVNYTIVTVTNITESDYLTFDCSGGNVSDFIRDSSYSQYDVDLIIQ